MKIFVNVLDMIRFDKDKKERVCKISQLKNAGKIILSTSRIIQPSYTIRASIFEKVFRPEKFPILYLSIWIDSKLVCMDTL